jgi:hypothetical protein
MKSTIIHEKVLGQCRRCLFKVNCLQTGSITLRLCTGIQAVALQFLNPLQ